jgi:hypothetical protein
MSGDVVGNNVTRLIVGVGRGGRFGVRINEVDLGIDVGIVNLRHRGGLRNDRKVEKVV